jgi:DNA-binding CsgD family transcriptional regulator
VKAIDRLTPRELQVVGLFNEGLPDKEIALLLGIDYRTVKNHARSVYVKLGVRGRGEAAAVARRAGVLEHVPPAG